MANDPTPIGAALLAGKVDQALKVARQWSEASQEHPKEQAVRIARAVGHAYREFAGPEVEEFLERADQALSPQVVPIVRKAVGRLTEMAEEWAGRVRACYEERLARELRDRLREKDFQPALERIALLCAPPPGTPADRRAEDIQRRASYTGSVMGTCIHHPGEVEHLVRLAWQSMDALGLDKAAVTAMKEAKEETLARVTRAGTENLENQWIAELKRTQVDLMQLLPPKNNLGDPTPEELRDVGDLFRSVLRVPLDSGNREIFTDATLIAVDFLPKEVSATARSTGVEQRAYEQTGFRARKAVAQALMEIGATPRFTEPYLEWGRAQLGEYHAEQVLELMGGLRSELFGDFLLETWRNASRRKEFRRTLTVAIGNLASADAAEVLLDELQDVFEGKATSVGEQLKRLNQFKVSSNAIDAGAVRRAKTLLEGLGRIVRSPRTEDALRRQIVERVVDTVPDTSLALNQLVASEVVAARPEVLDGKRRQWAVERLVESLWVQDQSTDLHKGGEREVNILGAREEVAKGIRRLTKGNMGPLLQHFDKMSSRYSGGYIAAAEILKKTADPRCVPVLGKMLLHAALHEEGRENVYQQEMYWDSTAQQRVPLTREKVLADLIEAIGTIGGGDAQRHLRDLKKKVQVGRVQLDPSGEAIQLLARYLEETSEESDVPAEPGAPGEAEAAPPKVKGQSKRKELVEVDPAELKKLVKALTGSHFLMGANKKAQLRIQALVRLGQLTPPEALDAIFATLADKNPMVQSAAMTAAEEYADPDKPDYLLARMLDHLEKAFDSPEPEVRKAALRILKEIGPSRPPVRKRMENVAKVGQYTESRKAVLELLAGRPPSKEQPDDEDAPEPSQDQPKQMTLLEQKRQYMLARKAWIDGGKRGDPPAPPAGVAG